MDVEQLRSARQALESDLLRLISERVAKFREETNFSPRSISVDMTQVPRFGEPEWRYIVGGVRAEVEL